MRSISLRRRSTLTALGAFVALALAVTGCSSSNPSSAGTQSGDTGSAASSPSTTSSALRTQSIGIDTGSASSSSAATSATSSAASTTAAMSDRPLRVLQAYPPSTFNQNFDPTRAMIRIDSQVLESATRYVGTGQDLTLKPWLVTGWSQVDEHTWQFKVRPGITFTNGEPLTAEAFKASLDSVLAKQDGKVRSHYTNLSISVVDDMTFNVKSTFVNDGSLPAQMSALYIMPPKYLAQVGAEQFGLKPIGTGPYTVSAFTPGSTVTLTANPNYWGDPKPSIKTVTVSTVGDPSTRVSQLLAGGADLVDGVTTDLVSRLNGTTAEARSTPTVERTFLLINTKSGATADLNVRKAINMAIDRNSIVKDLLDGNGFATQNIFVPLESGYNADFNPFPYDPSAAKALVDSAGAVAKKPFKLYYPNTFADFPAVAQAIQAELQDIGLNVTLEAGAQSPTLSALKASTDGGMAIWNFGPGFIDSAYMLDIYFAEGTGYGSLASSPEATELSKKARETTDPKERQSLYEQITKNVVTDNAFVAPLYSNVDIWGATPSLSWLPSAAADYNFALAAFK